MGNSHVPDVSGVGSDFEQQSKIDELEEKLKEKENEKKGIRHRVRFLKKEALKKVLDGNEEEAKRIIEKYLDVEEDLPGILTEITLLGMNLYGAEVDKKVKPKSKECEEVSTSRHSTVDKNSSKFKENRKKLVMCELNELRRQTKGLLKK